MRRTARRQPPWGLAVIGVVGVIALISSCVNLGDDDEAGGGLQDVPEGCTAIDMAVSPEKFDLLTDMSRRFNDSKEAKSDGCAFVRVQRKSSGASTQLLADGWPDAETNGPQPAVWSPAASSWATVLNERQRAAGQPEMAPDSKPFMLTPLVIAMPKPMAETLGYPATPLGFSDIINLAQDPGGWAARGHPEWGPFKLGKTNPNFSTSGLNVTIAEYYAATGKTADLSLEDLARPEADAFARSVESSVVHYGDTTLTFLNNWYRNDARGTALTYVSAVAVEEKSVIDYNRGNPDGTLDAGERPRPPRTPLVAIYPKEGTLFSDNPFVVLDAPWVSPQEKAGARKFEQYVQRPENQRKVLEFGFRPGNPQVGVGPPIDGGNGLDPGQPQNVLEVPDGPVLVRVIDLWGQQRKAAKVLLVVDVSGSMGDPASDDGDRTKLDVAKEAAIAALPQFKDDDLVGLRLFTTGIRRQEPTDYVDVVPIAPIGGQREQLRRAIDGLVPMQATPLYTAARASYEEVRSQYDPARINAVVLLTDGRNEDPRNDDLNATLAALRVGNEGTSAEPVRLFTIAYGKDADLGVLRRMSEATNAASYDAKDPATINAVFTAVVSNF